jgi:hypothetical protein
MAMILPRRTATQLCPNAAAPITLLQNWRPDVKSGRACRGFVVTGRKGYFDRIGRGSKATTASLDE